MFVFQFCYNLKNYLQVSYPREQDNYNDKSLKCSFDLMDLGSHTSPVAHQATV